MRVIGLAGWSGAGKTTLIVKLIPYLRERGITVSTLKHAHHAFDVDQPGKDSYLHREAGAREVLVEGYKRDGPAKNEVHRTANTKPFLYPEDPTIAALATDAADCLPLHLPHAHLDDIAAI